jgi:2-C-methyl-D-erythritol 4-phosphate cytidylyltransferase
MTDRVEGLVPAGGSGNRLGQGPKALLRLGEETLVERSVRMLRPLCERVLVAAPSRHVDEVAGLVSGPSVAVIAGGSTRLESVRRLVEQARGDWLLIADVVHPFIDGELARSVLEAARQDGAACAALLNGDHVLEPDTGKSFDAGTLCTLQKPIACRIEALRKALDAGPEEMGVAQALERSGHAVTLVPGKPTNVKVTHAADWQLAEAIERFEREAGLG